MCQVALGWGSTDDDKDHTRMTAPTSADASSGHRARFADPEHDDLDDVVETEALGLAASGSAWSDLGRLLRRRLDTTGFAGLPGFLRADAVRSLDAEFDRLLDVVDVTPARRTATAGAVTAGSTTSAWRAGHITRDMIPAHSLAQRLYVSPRCKELIAAATGLDRVFEYADPIAGLVVTVVPPGGCYGWHLDHTDVVVTIAIRVAEVGGVLEFCPPGEPDPATAAIQPVRSAVGDLQILRGGTCLHRVTEVGGDDTRLTLVLGYADRPGVIGEPDRTRRIYGRVTEAHLLAGARR